MQTSQEPALKALVLQSQMPTDDGSGDMAVAEVHVEPDLDPRPFLFSEFCVREVVA